MIDQPSDTIPCTGETCGSDAACITPDECDQSAAQSVSTPPAPAPQYRLGVKPSPAIVANLLHQTGIVTDPRRTGNRR